MFYASLWLGTSARAHVHTLSPYIRNRLTDCAKIGRVARYPNVTRFTKIGGWVTAHTHECLQFCCLGNRWALSLKSHQKQVYLFRARSFIAKQGVLMVNIDCESLIFCEQIRGKTKNTTFSQKTLKMIFSKKLRFDFWPTCPMGGVRWSNMLDTTHSVQADSCQ